MKHTFQLTENETAFEEKVYVIADEVLAILKELSKENKEQICSKTIAEKMFGKDTVKNVLATAKSTGAHNSGSNLSIKNISHSMLDKLSGIMPPAFRDIFNDVKDKFNSSDEINNSTEWLDSPIDAVNQYFASLTKKNRELEDFLQQTMTYLSNTESQLAGEISSQHQKFSEDRNFEDNISENITEMKTGWDSGDLDSIKRAVLHKLENINTGIAKKRDQDIQRFKDTEKTLEDMSNKMSEIKQEADEIRKKSEDLEYQSYRDNLTGLHNRRAYDEKVTEVLAHVDRYDIKASLMVCDIDYFKKINDNFGHKVGDLALKKLSILLCERLRKNDFVARYGGEEFVVILPHTDAEGAMIAGESIRSYIDKAVFSYKNKHIPLTVSVGISIFQKGDDVNSVFERADKALYLAKKSGRNMVTFEDEGEIAGTAVQNS